MFYKRIIAWFSVLVICFSIVPAVHADNEYISKNVTYWEQRMHDLVKTASGIDLVGPAVQSIAAFLEGDICAMSDDGYHYGTTLLWVSDSSDKYGRYMAKAVCKFCNKRFNCYASDLQQSYETQVSELPATGYNSAGRLIWQPTVSDVIYAFSRNTSFSPSYLSSGNGLYRIRTGSFYSECIKFDFRFPFPGSYFTTGSLACEYFCQNSSGASVSGSFNYSEFTPFFVSSSASYLGFSDRINGKYVGLGFDLSCPLELSDINYASTKWYFPVFEVIPLTAIDTGVDGPYSVNSRSASITGDYGIIGDNGQIIKVEGDRIVNETNNTYYNPATGETHTLSDWSYNYADRSYTVTTESGDTVTITYGDENVVIKEGDTTYNVYYLVGGSDTPGPATCNHQWTETSSTPVTCTVSGSRLLTCSLCGQTKTDIISAPGHAWIIKQSVSTEYDDEGNKTQDGYTIYECTVCGEQYKDMEGTGPPPSRPGSGGDVDDGGLLEFFQGVVKSLSDNLFGAVELLQRFFSEIPKLFGGFLEFLSAMFPFLPDDIIFLFTFGFAALVFIGLIKAIRRWRT